MHQLKASGREFHRTQIFIWSARSHAPSEPGERMLQCGKVAIDRHLLKEQNIKQPVCSLSKFQTDFAESLATLSSFLSLTFVHLADS